MPLSVKKIDALKPKKNVYLNLDERGLYLAVLPSGSKSWRFRYQIGGEKKQIVLGGYPDLSLAQAREIAREKRLLLAERKDPATIRKMMGITFEDVALEWFSAYKGQWTVDHADLTWRRLEQNLFPWIGKLPIAEIGPQDLLACLRRIEDRGSLEVAKRVRAIASNIFMFSIAEGRDHQDPAAMVAKALKPVPKRHLAAVTKPVEVAKLLQAMGDYHASFVVRTALWFSAHTFQRPGEVRHAEWSEIDFEAALWTIPAHKMKKRKEHLVPLSTQAVDLLLELQPMTGNGQYVFPSNRGKGRCMSENTVRVAIRALGYDKDQMTAHGFRTMASTLLHESGKWDSQVIELQLAHVDKNTVRGVYNRALRLDERRRMMQWYSDYLDLLKAGGKVIQFPAVVNE
jgi:integrase